MAMDLTQIRRGTNVYGSDGEKVGDVEEVSANYILVQKGMIFQKEFYIPADSITSVDDDGVYLSVSKDQIGDMGWDQPPTRDTGYASPEYSTSSATDGTEYRDNDETVTTQSATTSDDEGLLQTRSSTTTTDSDYMATDRDESATMETESREVDATPAMTETRDATRTDDDNIRVQRHEEELQAETVGRQAGEVRIDKTVEEEQQTLEVPVTREEVHVQSRTVDRGASSSGDAFQEDVIEVPLYAEEVEVTKEARVVEELEIEKRAVQGTETVTDTVRKERINVEESGDLDEDRNAGDPLDRDYQARN
ncbi:MAG: DUF2382 domain-containing protein [Chloroflexia bacterium]